MPASTRFRAAAVAVLLTVLLGFTAACGSTAPAPSAGAGPTAGATPSTTSSPASGRCANAGTRHFEKTRLVADLALAYGAFHRYLYKPYRAGTFGKGAPGRTTAIIKGGLAAAAIVKLMKNAAANAAADPTLCQYVPSMSGISDQLTGLAGQLAGGGAGGLTQAEGLFGKLKSVVGFTDGGNTALPGLG